MPLCVFSGADDNEPFKEWLRTNRAGGFYLNVLSSSEGKLHAAACDHVWDKDFEQKDHLTQHSKVVSLSVAELRAYAEENDITVTACHRKTCS